MCHRYSHFTQRLDGDGGASSMQQLPVCNQFCSMQFRPCLDKTALLLRKRPGNEFHGTNREDRSFVLSVSMEMRHVMRHAGLGEHADDDSEKPAWRITLRISMLTLKTKLR